MQRQRHIAFNNLSPEDQSILYQLAYTSDGKQRYYAPAPSFHHVPFMPHALSFSQPVYVRSQEHDPEGRRLAILTSKLGEGHFGCVYKINELELTKDGRITSFHPKSRVLKMMLTELGGLSYGDLDHSEIKNIQSKLKRESRFSSKLKHLHMKEVVFENHHENDSSISSYLVMHEMPGIELKDIIDNLKFNKLYLTARQLVSLAIRVAEAVKRQVHDVDLVHRDIKPENIMVDLSNPDDALVHLVDFGLAKHVDEDDIGKNLGTKIFWPYEQWMKQGTNKKSDIYSLGATFHELFTGKVPDSENTSYSQSINFHVASVYLNFIDSDFHQGLLCDILKDMTKKDKDQRISIEECVDRLYQLRRFLIRESDSMSRSTKLEKQMHLKAREINLQFSMGCSMGQISKLFEPIIDVDNLYAINEFKFALGAGALTPCASVRDIFLRFYQIDKSYSVHKNMLAGLISKYEKNINDDPQADNYKKLIELLKHKQEKHGGATSLDEMVTASQKIMKSVTRHQYSQSSFFYNAQDKSAAKNKEKTTCRCSCVVL